MLFIRASFSPILLWGRVIEERKNLPKLYLLLREECVRLFGSLEWKDGERCPFCSSRSVKRNAATGCISTITARLAKDPSTIERAPSSTTVQPRLNERMVIGDLLCLRSRKVNEGSSKGSLPELKLVLPMLISMMERITRQR
ncbi:MAG: hypothetical protein ACUVTL_06245 [Thermoproteota archaeon]